MVFLHAIFSASYLKTTLLYMLSQLLTCVRVYMYIFFNIAILRHLRFTFHFTLYTSKEQTYVSFIFFECFIFHPGNVYEFCASAFSLYGVVARNLQASYFRRARPRLASFSNAVFQLHTFAIKQHFNQKHLFFLNFSFFLISAR